MEHSNPQIDERIVIMVARLNIVKIPFDSKLKFDPTVNTFLNKSYKINRIINHLRRKEDHKLNFDG